jgi:subtilisin family serine protease
MCSGIETSHPEFDGRAKIGVDFIEDYYEDLYGHGTSVAGIITIIAVTPFLDW